MVSSSSSYSTQIVNTLAQEGTSWIFNPPSAPHFGGIWEAAVTSAKHHMRRVIEEQVLIFSELATLMCRIESCRNSRPLTALTDDPTDLDFLLPSHFLIQRSSFIVPEGDVTNDNIPAGKRWLLIPQEVETASTINHCRRTRAYSTRAYASSQVAHLTRHRYSSRE